MDKFFLAVIGVFMTIFAVLKIQLASSKKKAESAKAESARLKVEKDAVQTTSDVTGALARKLSELNHDSPVVTDAPSDTPLDAPATTLSNEEKVDYSFPNVPESPKTEVQTEGIPNMVVEPYVPKNDKALSSETLEQTREQLKRIRQLRGL